MAIYVPSIPGGILDVKGASVTVDDSGISEIVDLDGKEVIDLINMENFCLWIHNTGANPFVACDLMHSPDAINWEVTNSTFFATLAAGAIRSLENKQNGRRYFKIIATTGAGITTTANIWLSGRVGA